MAYEVTYAGELKDQREQDEPDMTEPRVDAILITSDGPLTDEDRAEIEERFSYGHCGCEHDCCGHRFSIRPRITEIYPGEYVVTVYSARNY